MLVADLSFISLATVLPALTACATTETRVQPVDLPPSTAAAVPGIEDTWEAFARAVLDRAALKSERASNPERVLAKVH